MKNYPGEDVLFPARCPFCDGVLAPGELYHSACLSHTERIREPSCRICGIGLAGKMIHPGGLCGRCERRTYTSARGAGVFPYRAVQEQVLRMKSGDRPEYARAFGDLMAERLEASGIPKPDVLIPVPLTAAKRSKRGYNQAELLAERVSMRTGIPVRTDALYRLTEGVSQKASGALERRENVKRTFIARANVVESLATMLIDDIYTTGSTIDACAAALAAAGASGVFFMALAISEEAGDDQ